MISLFSCKGKIEQSPEIAGRAKDHTIIPVETSVPPKVNNPPEIISMKLSPLSPVRGDRIETEIVTNDADSDIVTVTFQWGKNGGTLPGSSDSLYIDPSEFERGDKIYITATPFDGKQKGTPITLVTYIFNSPPQIKSSIEDSKFEGNNFIYQLNAEDPDGDPLTYSLKVAPEDMTIDSSTGLVKWNVPQGFKGKPPVTVSVDDGHGGNSSMSFFVEITTEAKK